MSTSTADMVAQMPSESRATQLPLPACGKHQPPCSSSTSAVSTTLTHTSDPTWATSVTQPSDSGPPGTFSTSAGTSRSTANRSPSNSRTRPPIHQPHPSAGCGASVTPVEANSRSPAASQMVASPVADPAGSTATGPRTRPIPLHRRPCESGSTPARTARTPAPRTRSTPRAGQRDFRRWTQRQQQGWVRRTSPVATLRPRVSHQDPPSRTRPDQVPD